jgi:hypothetical protein
LLWSGWNCNFKTVYFRVARWCVYFQTKKPHLGTFRRGLE